MVVSRRYLPASYLFPLLVFVILIIPASISTECAVNPVFLKKETVLIWTDSKLTPNNLLVNGIAVQEVYDSYVLAEVTDGQKKELVSCGVQVTQMPDIEMIRAGTYEFNTSDGPPQIPPKYKIDYSDMYIVKFGGPVKRGWKDALRTMGAHVFETSPLYKFAYCVRMNEETKKEVMRLDCVKWIDIYQPAYKILDKTLFDSVGMVHISVFCFEKCMESVRKCISKLHLSNIIVHDGIDKIEVIAPASLIPEIARIPEVQWLARENEMKTLSDEKNEITPMNDRAGEYVDLAHYVWDPYLNNLGIRLTGDGETIGIADTGFDTGTSSSGHFDFTRGPKGNRLVLIQSAGGDTQGHGTAVAGTVLGNGYCSLRFLHGKSTITADDYPLGYAGAAPEGKLCLIAGLTSASWYTLYSAGARIFTNSWGSGPGGYDSTVDEFMFQHPDALVFFAAGNTGPGPSTLQVPSTNWNGVCVGASNNYRPEEGSFDINKVAEFSGRGPGWAGSDQVKPDIVAVGTALITTASSRSMNVGDGWPDPLKGLIDSYPDTPDCKGDYTMVQGTSFSCPRAAGLAMIIRQFYREVGGWPNGITTPSPIADPSPVLIKATLIHGASDMGYGYPSMDQGWGRANIRDSLTPVAPARNQFSEHTFTSSGQIWSPAGLNLNVSSDRVPLKVTLVWNNTVTADLMNDLDLVVKSPSGTTTYHGNVFSPGTGFSQPNPSTNDVMNNVEVVRVDQPTAGEWSISVAGSAIASESRAAILVTADIGPKTTHQIALTSTDPNQFVINAGGTVTYNIKVLNFGNGPEDIHLSDSFTFPTPGPVSWTFDYNGKKDITGMASNTEQTVTVMITTPSSTAFGTYKVRFTGIGGTSQAQLDISIYIKATGLPCSRIVTNNNGTYVEPWVETFRHLGFDYVLITYVNKTDELYNTVELIRSTDGGTTFDAPIVIDNLQDKPTQVRISRIPSTSSAYQNRVFISWSGTDPAKVSTADGSWAEVAYADPPYTTWTMSNARITNVNFGPNTINNKRTVFTVPDPRDASLWLVFEHLDYTDKSANQPITIDTAAQISKDGGSTWDTPSPITPGDGNYYFFPSGCCDMQGVPWVFYYWRSPAGVVRSIAATNYNFNKSGHWSDKIDIIIGKTGTPYQNLMDATATTTPEGINNNRIYIAFTSGQSNTGPRKIYVIYTDDQGVKWEGLDGAGNPTHGPFSEMVYKTPSDYGPVVDIDMTSNGTANTMWLTYLDIGPTINPFNVPNIFTTWSMNSFLSGNWQRLTGEGFVKAHPVTSTIDQCCFTVYSCTDEYGRSKIYLTSCFIGPEPPEIYNEYPLGIVPYPRPKIGANYSSPYGIDLSSVRILLDGVNVTKDATITNSSVSYVPSADLAVGVHTVRLEVTDNSIYRLSNVIDWQFTETDDYKIDHVTLTPDIALVWAGNSRIFVTTAYNIAGTNITSQAQFDWYVDPPLLGSVDNKSSPNVKFTALNNVGGGKLIVNASIYSQTVSTWSQILQEAPPPHMQNVSIEPESVTIQFGQKVMFSATAYDNLGTPIDHGVTYQWDVTSIIGTIDNPSSRTTNFTAGIIPGIGMINVTVLYDGVTKMNSSRITVSSYPVLKNVSVTPNSVILNQGSVIVFRSRAFDSLGNDITANTSFTWTVYPVDIGNLTSSGDLVMFTAGSIGGTGSVTVTANYNSVSVTGHSDITVIKKKQIISKVVISPAEKTCTIGNNVTFTAKAYDVNNTEIFGLTYHWIVSGDIGIIISNNGDSIVFFANAVGSCTIKVNCTCNGVTREATARITVIDNGSNPNSIHSGREVANYILIATLVVAAAGLCMIAINLKRGKRKR